MGIDKEKLKIAFDEYMENPAWAEYYNNAPSDNCKRYIRFNWFRSKYGEPEDIEEFKKLRDSYWDKLSIEDCEYIREHVGNNPFRKVCSDKIKELKSKQ